MDQFAFTCLGLVPMTIEEVIEEFDLLLSEQVLELTFSEESHGEVHHTSKLLQTEIHDYHHIHAVVVK